MAEIKIVAESRTAFGKGAARRIRRDAKVPAVLYGHGLDPLHVSLPGHELMLALKNSNALLSVELDGSSQLALPRQVQRDPIRGYIEHADLLLVRRGEKVTVNVPVVLSGEAESGALVVTETTEIALEAEATHIPEAVEISIERLEIGTQILAPAPQLPEGSTLQIDPDPLIVNVTAAPTAADVEAELAQAEADAGIERDEPEHLDEDAADEAIGTDGDAPAEDGAATDGQ
ncbi:50S ribosomal protein L25/general stress protein Ctc [soil metagenome]